MAQAGTERTVRTKGRAIFAILVLLGAIGLSLQQPAQADLLPGLLSPPTTKPAPKPTAPKPKPHVPVRTMLAAPIGDVPTYASPGGARVGAFGHWYGWPQSSPILETRGEWLKIRLPERPNGSTAWIKRSGVKITYSVWRIVIRVGQTKLTAYQNGFPVWTVPVGLGKSSTPTPTGNFYLGVMEPQGNGSNGWYALATTAHSEAIQSWQGAGDAVIAIHGPVSAKSDRAIGANGTYISNGCVRMHLHDLEHMYEIPVGTPVDIVP
jgi:hypothetical protein